MFKSVIGITKGQVESELNAGHKVVAEVRTPINGRLIAELSMQRIDYGRVDVAESIDGRHQSTTVGLFMQDALDHVEQRGEELLRWDQQGRPLTGVV